MIFLDFDGTIVDVWDRYFKVFCTAAQTQLLRIEDYIPVKRRLCRDDLVAESLGVTLPSTYYAQKKELLESPSYLSLDTLLVSTGELLQFFKMHSVRILTIRRQPQAFFQQLEHLGLTTLRESSIVLNPSDQISKYTYLQTHFSSEKNILVGDSSTEGEASTLENTTVFLVRSGLRNPNDLDKWGTCGIINDLSEFLARDGE